MVPYYLQMEFKKSSYNNHSNFDNIHYITSNIFEVHVQNKCTNCFNVILERIDILKLK